MDSLCISRPCRSLLGDTDQQRIRPLGIPTPGVNNTDPRCKKYRLSDEKIPTPGVKNTDSRCKKSSKKPQICRDIVGAIIYVYVLVFSYVVFVRGREGK